MRASKRLHFVNRLLPIAIDDVAAIPDDVLANIRIAASQSIRIAAAEAYKADLLYGKREIAFTRWFEFQAGVLHISCDLVCRVGNGLSHFLKHCVLGSILDRQEALLLWSRNWATSVCHQNLLKQTFN